ncbi:hypothetical protein OAU77_01435 [Gammaproteobacteria bacterium]|nr:hypothetical protein [Gammaproteobacteria bacterium]
MQVRVVIVAITWGILNISQSAYAQVTPEVQSVLYEAADTLGLLRTPREVDRVITMIYSGSGTRVIEGETCVMDSYRASLRYAIPEIVHPFPVPGMRVDFTCVVSDAESQRYVQVVAGGYAWDEDEPGGNSESMPETLRERLLQIWLVPQGLVKAAVEAGELATASSNSDGNPMLTFPLPAPLDDTIVQATFDPEVFLYHTMPNGTRREFGHRLVHVETEFDGTLVEVTYANYQDWNESDYKADVLLPGHIIQTVDGVTVMDLNLSLSNTYNPYVVMPLPANIAAAGTAFSE